MMRNWIRAMAVLTALCLAATPALAKSSHKGTQKSSHKGTHKGTHKGGGQGQGLKGQIVSIAGDGGSLVLETKGHKGKTIEQKTITINTSTPIEIDGVAGKHAADLKSGMKATVKLSGDSATEIKATDHAAKHKNK